MARPIGPRNAALTCISSILRTTTRARIGHSDDVTPPGRAMPTPWGGRPARCRPNHRHPKGSTMSLSRRVPRVLAITVPALTLLAVAACGSTDDASAAEIVSQVTPAALSQQQPNGSDGGLVFFSHHTAAT